MTQQLVRTCTTYSILQFVNYTSKYKKEFIPKLVEPLVTVCLSTKYVYSIDRNILRINTILTVQELPLAVSQVGLYFTNVRKELKMNFS